ncbi:hypothetical protein O6H91_07G005700 [Diphasiastrum complanatum]|uniref:Uncharacterized protein n=1 Tax=Diphasiastrum complanatum TaxID=34168 RepID=A0ACC2D2T1_DIPCM|nr:hypothetical protein O6H91_07G005700 [Diphasiastrum complanatum]
MYVMASAITSHPLTLSCFSSSSSRWSSSASISSSRSTAAGLAFWRGPQLCSFQGRSRSVSRWRQSVLVLCCQLKKLSEVEPLVLLGDDAISLLTSLPPSPGVYAVYDKVGDLQFLGLSRRVSSSIQAHAQDLPQLVGSVKINVVDAPDRNVLTEAWKQWMEEHLESTGKVPPGNAAGDTTWTKRKKPLKPDLKLTPGPHVQLTVSLEQLIDKVVKEFKVVAFIKGSRTSPQCRFSHRVLTILNEQGVEYETLNVLDEEYNPGLREAIKAYSQWPTIPQVYVKGEFIGGADVLDEMVQGGEMKKILQD